MDCGLFLDDDVAFGASGVLVSEFFDISGVFAADVVVSECFGISGVFVVADDAVDVNKESGALTVDAIA